MTRRISPKRQAAELAKIAAIKFRRLPCAAELADPARWADWQRQFAGSLALASVILGKTRHQLAKSAAPLAAGGDFPAWAAAVASFRQSAERARMLAELFDAAAARATVAAAVAVAQPSKGRAGA
jgi:hypothetical protein